MKKEQTTQAVKTLEQCISTDEFNGKPGRYIYDPVSGKRTPAPADDEKQAPLEN